MRGKAVRNLSIRNKLFAMAGVAVLLLAATAAFAIPSLGAIKSESSKVADAQAMYSKISLAYESWLLDDDQSNMYAAVVALKDPSQAKLAETTWGQAVGGFEGAVKYLDEAAKIANTDAERADVKTIQASLADYNTFSLKLRSAAQAGNVQKAVQTATVDNLKPSNDLPVEFEKTRDVALASAASQQKALDSKVSQLTTMMIVITFVGLLLMLIATLWISKMITRPLKAFVDGLNQARNGDLRVSVAVESSDEVGQASKTFNEFIDSLRNSVTRISETTKELAASSQEMSSLSHMLSANAEETSAQSMVVSAASEQVTANVTTVAAAVEEMTASIAEIAQNATEAGGVTNEASQMATVVNENIGRLDASSSEINEVVELINSIAEQTNVLALNATIEAARAGAAGRGFAVVANEVKDLANETSQATAEIAKKIEAIQHDTKSAIDSVGRIVAIIERVDDIQTTIASAVEEQSATTNEIARSVSEAAMGTGEITNNISGVAQAAESTASGAQQSNNSADGLSGMASTLRELVDHFQY